MFTTRPPANVEALPPSRPVECTTSYAAPVIDAAIAGFQAVRTVYALSESDSDYANFPISRDADVALGAALMATFVVSTVYGVATINECNDAKDAHARRRRKPRRLPPRAAPEPPPETRDRARATDGVGADGGLSPE